MSAYRLGVAFFYHESHSFSPLRTGIAEFEQESLVRGADIFQVFRGTSTEVGGFLDALAGTEFEAVPLLAAAAMPAGQVTTSAYEQIRDEMLACLAEAGDLDGLLLGLHGAMVVDDYQDPETDLLRAIRLARGAEFPIALTLDLHANVTADLVGLGASCFGFQTYPHVDMYEQGRRAAEAVMRQVRDTVSYSQSFAKLPALLPSINMRTAEGPMALAVQAAQEWEGRDEIVAASVFGGFPYSDIEGVGASVVVLATDPDMGSACCRDLAELLWRLRDDFRVDLPDAATAVAMALESGRRRPVALADIADNPLSGGSADTTTLLAEILRSYSQRVLAGALCDNDVLLQAQQAGVGAVIECQLGAKLSSAYCDPLDLEVEVVALTDGRFRNSGPMNNGLVVDVRGAAHLRCRNVDLLLTGRPVTANDPELFGHIGLDITSYDLLALKVKNHFRAAFEPLVGEIIYVDAPGVASNDFTHFTYRNVPPGLWPFDSARAFDPEVIVTHVPQSIAR